MGLDSFLHTTTLLHSRLDENDLVIFALECHMPRPLDVNLYLDLDCLLIISLKIVITMV